MKKKTYTEKEKNILTSWFSYFRRLVFDQSSPVPPVSEYRGGSLSVMMDRLTDKDGNPCV